MVARVIISGFVHGVGFRQHIGRKARGLDIAGWVRNLSDGRVEALFSGSKEKIEEAVGECWKGPFLSEVKSVDVEWVENNRQYKDFEIRT